MNYMAEVAKMLDVEMNKAFEVDYGNNRAATVKIENTGLRVINKNWDFIGEDLSRTTLDWLLGGRCKVVRQPWKPSEDEVFWRIDPFGNPVLDKWTGHSYHLTLYKLGNCYRTEADSTQHRDKWVAFYASDEVLEV